MTTFDIERFEALVAGGSYDEAMALLDSAIGAGADAGLLRRRGDLNWKLGRQARAISDYEAAVAMEPESPAAQSLAMAREVMDFFNPDLYNP